MNRLVELKAAYLRLYNNISNISTDKERLKAFQDRSNAYINALEKEIKKLKEGKQNV